LNTSKKLLNNFGVEKARPIGLAFLVLVKKNG